MKQIDIDGHPTLGLADLSISGSGRKHKRSITFDFIFISRYRRRSAAAPCFLGADWAGAFVLAPHPVTLRYFDLERAAEAFRGYPLSEQPRQQNLDLQGGCAGTGSDRKLKVWSIHRVEDEEVTVDSETDS